MLSAFQLENNRLCRIELDENDDLSDSLWVDLVEPEESERDRVQQELGQSLATRPELEDIESSARFFEDEDGLHIHSFFFLKMLMTMLVIVRLLLLFVKVGCIPYVSVNYLPFASIVCVPVSS